MSLFCMQFTTCQEVLPTNWCLFRKFSWFSIAKRVFWSWLCFDSDCLMFAWELCNLLNCITCNCKLRTSINKFQNDIKKGWAFVFGMKIVLKMSKHSSDFRLHLPKNSNVKRSTIFNFRKFPLNSEPLNFASYTVKAVVF